MFEFPETAISEDVPQAEWSIYIYMVGSDLEDADLNQLSSLTATMVAEEAQKKADEYNNLVFGRIKNFAQEISDMGMTLPNVFYNKSKDAAKAEPNTDLDCIGYGTYNIETMMDCDIPDGVQIIIQTGGARRWQTALVNPNRSQRFVLDSSGFYKVYDDNVVNMADPDSLEEFMVFCKENYPAKNEMILFWDHGGGYGGFGVDYIFGEDMMTIREMAGAFENVNKLYSTDDKLFDAIGFDACLMSNLETVRLFSDYADYYYASAEELSGLGWGYDVILEALYDNPGISPEELGKVIARANVANVQLEDFEGVYPATFSLVDLNEVEDVYDAYSLLAKSMLRDSIADTANLTKISAAATNTLAYAYGSTGGFNVIDLGVFMDNLADIYPDETKAVKDALNESILFLESTTYFEGGSGMSVYFPARMENLMSLRKLLFYMEDLSDNPDLDALFYYKVAGCLNERLNKYVESQGYGSAYAIDFSYLEDIPNLDCETYGDGNFSITLYKDDKDLIQAESFGLIYIDEETDDVVYFSEVDKVNSQLDEYGDCIYTTDFDMTWPSLEGSELPAVVISEDDASTSYRVPIDYYGDSCYMLFKRDKASGEYTISGFTLDLDNGTGIADRDVIEFEEGEEFSVVYQWGNLNSNYQDVAYVDYVYKKDMKITDKYLADGLYLEYLRFDDLRSDKYYSPMVVITVENGQITDQYVDYSIVGTDTSERKQ